MAYNSPVLSDWQWLRVLASVDWHALGVCLLCLSNQEVWERWAELNAGALFSVSVASFFYN